MIKLNTLINSTKVVITLSFLTRSDNIHVAMLYEHLFWIWRHNCVGVVHEHETGIQ